MDIKTPTVAAVVARITDSQPLIIVCAWCPDFNPQAQPAGVSHGICPSCRERFEQEIA